MNVKNRLVFTTLVFLFLLIVLPSSAIHDVAYADGDSISVLMTCLDENGDSINYTGYPQDGFYRREIALDIAINPSLQATSIKLKLYQHNGVHYVDTGIAYTKEITSQSITLSIPDSGRLEIIIIAYDAFGMELSRLPIYVLSDNTPPIQPIIDEDVLQQYHVTPFNIGYTLHRDLHSGINFTKSRYYFNKQGQTLFEKKLEIESYLEKFIEISDNGTLYFELVDYAGNISVFSYPYTRYGYPVPQEPVISVSTTDYSQSVTVSISWGEEYDNHPFATKNYSIATTAGSIKYRYTEPFVISNEGMHNIIAHYTIDDTDYSVERVINNIDKTPPSYSIIENEFQFVCQLTAEKPIIITLRAQDSLSGIKNVRLSNGELLENYNNFYYKISIMNLDNLRIIAEDNAGNTTIFSFLNTAFDYQLIQEYNDKFKLLDSADYTSDGWDKVLYACQSLSNYLTVENPSTSQIAVLKRAIDNAIKGDIIFVTRIEDIISGLHSDFSFDIQDNQVDIKKGGLVRSVISEISKSTDAINQNTNLAKQLSAIDNGNAYCFNITHYDSNNAVVDLVADITFNFTPPQNTQTIKLYADKNGTLTAVDASLKDGKIVVNTALQGDFYLICQMSDSQVKEPIGITIGDKFYSLQLLLITSAIFVSVLIVVSIFILKYFKSK